MGMVMVVGSQGELIDVVPTAYGVVPMEGEETGTNPLAVVSAFLFGALAATGVFVMAGYKLIK